MRPLVIISGASRGIGRATGHRFLKDNWSVHSIGRSTPDCLGEHWTHSTLDPIDLDALAEFAQTLALPPNQPISLVLNAATAAPNTLQDMIKTNGAEMQRQLNINVVAPAVLASAFSERMPRGSSIVFVGSTLGTIGVPNSCAYVTSKHALVGLHRAATQDLFGKGISSVCVQPGFTDTEALREHTGGTDLTAFLKEKVSYGRLIAPEEIAEAIYAAATQPVFNGSIISCDLGQRST